MEGEPLFSLQQGIKEMLLVSRKNAEVVRAAELHRSMERPDSPARRKSYACELADQDGYQHQASLERYQQFPVLMPGDAASLTASLSDDSCTLPTSIAITFATAQVASSALCHSRCRFYLSQLLSREQRTGADAAKEATCFNEPEQRCGRHARVRLLPLTQGPGRRAGHVGIRLPMMRS